MDEMTRKEKRQARRAERRANRKPFFETKVGGILKGVSSVIAPNLVGALEGVEDISEALKIISGEDSISDETRATLRELALKEYEIEVMDRTSAREREVRVLEAGGDNLMMKTIGWTISLCFIGLVASALGFIELPIDIDNGPKRDFLMLATGAVFAKMTSVVDYFFGSSMGSKQKTNILGN